MSVIQTDEYRAAFLRHATGQPLTKTQHGVLEQARTEARLPEGRYPLPCGVEPTPAHRGGDEVAVSRIDGATGATTRPRIRPRASRYSPWGDEER